MKIEILKKKFLDSVDMWLEERIDDMLKGNPTMTIPSIYMKRGCHNIIKKYNGKIDNAMDMAALFLADEDGEINTNTLFTDVMGMFNNMEETSFDMGFLRGCIGKGKLSITLPDNVLTNILLGTKKTIAFCEDDFLELKSLILTE